MPLHSALTGSELHENKGVASAADDTVATAASGATVWQKITTDNLDATSIFTTNRMALNCYIPDISASNVFYIPIPFDCTVDKVLTVLSDAITTSDATLNVKNGAGTSMGTITIPYSGSAAGDIGLLIPTSSNTISEDSKIQIDVSPGGSAASLFVTAYVTVTA